MSGTKKGGAHAAKTNVARHGKDFYARIGALGGRKSRGGGFAANRELARLAGAKGGRISRRRKAPVVVDVVVSATKPQVSQNDFDLAA